MQSFLSWSWGIWDRDRVVTQCHEQLASSPGTVSGAESVPNHIGVG